MLSLTLNRELLNSSRLETYESDLLHFLFDELDGQRDTVTLKDIGKKQMKFLRYFEKWRKQVTSAARLRNWWDETSIRIRNVFIGLSLVLFPLTVLCVIPFGQAAFILAIAPAILLPLSFIIGHRTFEGELDLARTKAYRRYLINRVKAGETESMGLDNAMIFGMVIGIMPGVYKNILRSETNPSAYPWFIYHSSGNCSLGLAIESMVQSTTSAMSSASGTGGGASVGGGGGASCGGGGAG
jgi:uncharacterized membrane protein